MTAIEESKDPSEYSNHDLMGSLLSHEHRLKKFEGQSSMEQAFQMRLNVNGREKGVASNRGKERGSRGRGRGHGQSYHKQSEQKIEYLECNFCKKKNHAEEDWWFKEERQCYKCHKYGHLTKNCREKGDVANFQEETSEIKEENLFYLLHRNYRSNTGCVAS